MNRLPPRPEVTTEEASLPPDLLAVIGTLARTYDPQRVRLLERAGVAERAPSSSVVRPLTAFDPAVTLDGGAVSASIVDVVTQAKTLVAQGFAVPFLTQDEALMTAEAGWWDALIGDVERRLGLVPRSIAVTVPGLPSVRAVFAERVAT